jgi:hypothetical protein
MAGDWIKIRLDLHQDFAVLQMARRLGVDRWAIVGRLSDIWGWIGSHTEDGVGVPLDSEMLDEHVSCPGFAEALRAVGWLSGRDGALTFPKWERHNSMSAKARALEAEAKRLRRAGRESDTGSDGLSDVASGIPSDKCPTNGAENVGPEKRREESKGDGKKARARDPLEWSELVGWVGVTAEDRESWGRAYPAVDIDRQLAAMHEWLRANPDRAVKKRWRRFVAGWLERRQERGGDRPGVPAANGAAPRARSWGTPVPMK